MTPVVAVARELKRRHKKLDFRFICDEKFASQAAEMFTKIGVKTDIISSGKLRRYTNVSKWRQFQLIFLDYWKNIPDLFRIVRGYFQADKIIQEFSPDVVFIKGGYVSLPVGLAAHRRKIPIVIHDSDTHPGLTNRILAKYATKIGTGAPIENYPSYPKKITKYVGIPISAGLKSEIVPSERSRIVRKMGFDPRYPIVLVTGGGGGSRVINQMTLVAAKQLIKDNVQILLLTGKNLYDETKMEAPKQKNLKIMNFVNGLSNVIMASDLIVTRAGATTLAELAQAAKPIILIPSPYLAADHQTKNAKIYEKSGGAIVLDERDFTEKNKKNLLSKAILSVINDKPELKKMSKSIFKYAKPKALTETADLIESAVK